jgi:hypothetical protein
MTELFNLGLFFFALAKVLVLTGLGPAIAIAILFESFRGGQLAKIHRDGLMPAAVNRATSLPRNLRRAA